MENIPDRFSVLKATVISVVKTVGNMVYFEVCDIETGKCLMCCQSGADLTEIHRYINNKMALFIAGVKKGDLLHIFNMTSDVFGLTEIDGFESRSIFELARITDTLERMSRSAR